MTFTEVADRIWLTRRTTYDVNVTVVGGDLGLVVIDTLDTPAAAEQLVADLRRLGAGEVVAVVNTHDHHDHIGGNAVLRAHYGPIPLHAHENASIPDVDRDFSSVAAIDLGDRVVELLHPGPGHTSGDLIALVPDADILVAGDLLEESALRHAVPDFGADCFPLEWPRALDLALGLITKTTRVIPGHGGVIDHDFVLEQRSAIGVVAETIRDLAGRGVPERDALGAAEWPYPTTELVDAVRRGYEQLPRSQKRLPLL